QLPRLVEGEPDRYAEAVAQRRGEEPGAGGGADEREGRERDLDRARGRSLADDQIELVILHRGVEHFLHRRIEAVDLIDEEYVLVLEIGQQCRQIARTHKHRARSRAKADAKLARDDLGKRGLAETGRPGEQHMVERLATRFRRLDEHREIVPPPGLTADFAKAAA